MGKDQYTIGHHSQWADQESDIRLHYIQVNGTIRMEELMGELVRFDAPNELYLKNVRIEWHAPASLEAMDERERAREESFRRQEMWERQQLAKLLQKYPQQELEA